MKPSVAIIIVNYNGFEDTVECIKSIKECSYDNYKIIVVDNASTIVPKEEILGYIKANSVFLTSDFNNGFSAGNNIGIKWALEHKYDYCLLINNDTTVDKKFLDRLVDVSMEYHDSGIVGGRICFYTQKKYIWYGGGHIDYVNGGAQHEHYKECFAPVHDIREVEFITGCLMLIPSKIFEKIGLLDETFFLYEEDLEFCLRVLNNGLRLLYVDDAIIYHKVSASTQKNSRMKSYYELRNKFIITNKYFRNSKSIHQKIIVRCLKDWIRGRRDSIAPLFIAYKDYKNGVYGKRG